MLCNHLYTLIPDPEVRMQLSKHLSLEEFTHSDKATELGIHNTLPDSLLPNAVYTACYLFEPVRKILGDVPIDISSGYRCEALNVAVRGVPTSQHVLAQAIDFIPSNMDIKEAFNILKASKSLIFDQLIMEHSKSGAIWIHVSIKQTGNRQQIIPYLEKP